MFTDQRYQVVELEHIYRAQPGDRVPFDSKTFRTMWWPSMQGVSTCCNLSTHFAARTLALTGNGRSVVQISVNVREVMIRCKS